MRPPQTCGRGARRVAVIQDAEGLAGGRGEPAEQGYIDIAAGLQAVGGDQIVDLPTPATSTSRLCAVEQRQRPGERQGPDRTSPGHQVTPAPDGHAPGHRSGAGQVLPWPSTCTPFAAVSGPVSVKLAVPVGPTWSRGVGTGNRHAGRCGTVRSLLTLTVPAPAPMVMAPVSASPRAELMLTPPGLVRVIVPRSVFVGPLMVITLLALVLVKLMRLLPEMVLPEVVAA